jgi:hypothetical protein
VVCPFGALLSRPPPVKWAAMRLSGATPRSTQFSSAVSVSNVFGPGPPAAVLHARDHEEPHVVQ